MAGPGNDTGKFATSSRNYDMWLPSVIANYRPNDAMVVRASIRKSYSRPAFDLLLGPTQVSRNDLGEVTGVFIPNPNLNAQTSWNYDASVEYKAGHRLLLDQPLLQEPEPRPVRDRHYQRDRRL